jgi:hypothetical protein
MEVGVGSKIFSLRKMNSCFGWLFYYDEVGYFTEKFGKNSH